MTATNIEITVDFDGIINNIKPVNGVYQGCDNYVFYSGQPVIGTTMTLNQNDEYTFTLEAQHGNQCIATELESFQDQDSNLVFQSDTNKLQLDCIAKTKNPSGVDVTLTVTFNNPKGEGQTAKWDPKIKVIGGI